MAPGFNHNPGWWTATDRPTQYILQHNDGRQEVKYAVPPNRPYVAYPDNLVDNNIDSLLHDHLIWCFILNVIYHGCINQKLSFSNIKSLLKFTFVFPRAHMIFDLKRAIDNVDTFFKNIQTRFKLIRTFPPVVAPR